MDDYIKVAGVTFDNPDGESRQTILRKLGFGYRYAILKQTTYDGERAVEVWTDSKFIGYVPKAQLDNALSYASILLVQILYYEEKNIFCAELSELQTPSDAEIAQMKLFCRNNKLAMPPMDKRAFKYTYDMFHLQNIG